MPRRQALPIEYGLDVIELRGRFYPVCVEQGKDGVVRLGSLANLIWEVEYELGIPFARGPQPAQGIISFGTWTLAADYCYRLHDSWCLPYQWQKMTAAIELYPERTVWYREVLQELGAYRLTMEVLSDFAHCSAFVKQMYCAVHAETFDEALELLYQKVYEQVQRTGEGTQEEAANV